VAEGGYYGMQTFDQHLLKHLRAGRITFDEAMRSATSPHDFKLMVAAEGSLGQVAAAQPAPQPEPQMTAGLAAPSAPPPPAPSAPPPGVQY
jgi:twitching motility protein PilT